MHQTTYSERYFGIFFLQLQNPMTNNDSILKFHRFSPADTLFNCFVKSPFRGSTYRNLILHDNKGSFPFILWLGSEAKSP